MRHVRFQTWQTGYRRWLVEHVAVATRVADYLVEVAAPRQGGQLDLDGVGGAGELPEGHSE